MDATAIRRIIGETRKECRLTQSDVGKRANVSRELVSRFENGEHDIGLSRLVRICDALGLEIVIRPGRGRPVAEELDAIFGDEHNE